MERTPRLVLLTYLLHALKTATSYRQQSFTHLFSVSWGRRAGVRADLLMFSHVVVFWTKNDRPSAADELIAGAEKYLKPIPGVLSFHIGRMVGSHRPVVDQSYQVALNLVFPNKKAQDDYQVHPLHVKFVEEAFKPNCAKCVVYDFE